MAFQATMSPGTVLKYMGASPLQIEELVSFTFAGMTRPSSEFTPISSVSRKTVRVGRGSVGLIKGEVAFDPVDPSHLKLISLFNADIANAIVAPWELASSEHGAEVLQWTGAVESLAVTFPNTQDPVKLSFGIAPAGVPASGSATSVTPSSTVNPVVGQGTQLALWVSSAYVKLNGVENLTLTVGARDNMQLPPMDQTAASGNVSGIRGTIKGSFDLLYDSTETNHTALKTAVDGALATNKLQVTMTDSANHKIVMDPLYFDGWEPAGIPGANRIKVGFTANCDLAVTS